ncbi:hypothetical protein N7603_04315 [Acholeplasma vituli]|uniref:Uncharacterized protein n=1 Tax=Paracholeplasma vituli TaxID=69473 RepID=A0ABT2PVA2_9MOLU|nr:hypothetical protein [Paracholeplasma vituli]MCU0104875.1 hypothetical protein [Paracholeplasma vituli]
MLEWLQALTPEEIIVFSGLLVLFISSILIMMRLSRIANRVGEQEFYILESLLEIEGDHYINLTIINKAFSTNHINVVGVELGNVSHPLEEKMVMIAPRSKYQVRFNLSNIKQFVFSNRKKYRKFRIYVENEIGLRKSIKPKINNSFMKKEYLKLKRQECLEAKRVRFESGQYNLFERTGLIVGLVFRPFAKLRRHMVLSTNKTLRESEIRRQQKKEHDAIKYKLDQDEFELNEIRIREQSIKENRTRELELERLKKEKELEIERIKEATLKREFEENKAKIEAIDPITVAKQELELEHTSEKADSKKRAKKNKINDEKIVSETIQPEAVVEVEMTEEPAVVSTDTEVKVGEESETVIKKPRKPREKKVKEVVEAEPTTAEDAFTPSTMDTSTEVRE